MPGLDPEIAVHRLNIKPEAKPIEQAQRRFHPLLMKKIEKKVKKFKDVGLIREEKDPDWLANIASVTKKNGQIRVCIDFRDPNNAFPKDEFPPPITEIMINNTRGYEHLSFIEGLSGYNQIEIDLDDERHTSFRTQFGTYCYTVMPFGLKNASATYLTRKGAMMQIFRDQQHKTVECYVDHLADLRGAFKILRKHNMRPSKAFWR